MLIDNRRYHHRDCCRDPWEPPFWGPGRGRPPWGPGPGRPPFRPGRPPFDPRQPFGPCRSCDPEKPHRPY